jgi:hypothetical protein
LNGGGEACAYFAVKGEHAWRVEGDDNYEPYYAACEECGLREPDPFVARWNNWPSGGVS